jgi:hypothetical protein
MCILVITLLLPVFGLSQSRVSGPVAGYVPDAGGASLQPVLGMTGAAILGDSRPLNAAWSMLGVSPSQEYLMATDRTSGDLLLVSTEDAVGRNVEGALRGADRVRMSPNGMSAVLRAGGRLQIVTGLPDSPRAQNPVDVSALGALKSLAVSDDGSLVLLVAGTGADTALYSINVTGEVRWLGALGQDARLSFANRTRSAAIAGVATNELWILDDAAGDFSLRRLSGPENGLSGPVGVAFSDDNRRVLAAHSRGIIRVNLDDTAVTGVACTCSPTLLARMRGNSTFRLTDVSDQPMWMVDGRAAVPQLWFVPPKAPASIDSGGGINERRPPPERRH